MFLGCLTSQRHKQCISRDEQYRRRKKWARPGIKPAGLLKTKMPGDLLAPYAPAG